MAVRERRMTGPSGAADIRVLAKSVRVTMLESGDEYDLPLDALDKGRKGGRYIVGLSSDKSKIMSLRPVKGQYIFSFDRLGNRKGAGPESPGVPDTKIRQGGPRQRKDGKGVWMATDEIVFTAVFKIESEGLYKGMLTGTNVPYSFVAPARGEAADIVDSKRNLGILEAFLRVVGGMNMATAEIPYSPQPPTMLTWLEKKLKTENRQFLGRINDNGYIELADIEEIPAELMPKAKKKAKK